MHRTVIALALLALAGCTTAESPDVEGMSLTGGDAIAHNSALQIIDPWPRAVQDKDLVVPAARASSANPKGEAAPDTAVLPLVD